MHAMHREPCSFITGKVVFSHAACFRTSDAGDDADYCEAQRGVAEHAKIPLEFLLVTELPDARFTRVQRCSNLAQVHRQHCPCAR